MRLIIHTYSTMSLLVLLIASVSVMSCEEEEELGAVTLTGQSKTYNLNTVSNSGIGGTVILQERSDHSTLVSIQLDGSAFGTIYPAHFYDNSIVETGDIIIDLNSVDGTSGKSETIVSWKKDGNKISYSQLLALDTHISIAESETNYYTFIAQVDAGGSEITGISKSYTLNPLSDSDISGTVKFTKRVNGTTLAVVDLNGTSPTGNYRVFICDNHIASGGSVVITLNSIYGSLDTSFTDVDQLNDGTTISYDQLLAFDRHVRVVSSESTPKCMAETNIGE